MRAAAKHFPNVKFACVDFAPGDQPVPPNLVGLRFREHEGSFLVGALAALVSKTKVLGFVGGMDIPLIHKFQAGYEAGAHHVCPTCKVLVGYAGTDLKAFADPTTGKELALTQLDQGADIIFHASGRTGTGVFNAVEERGKFAIGVDADQFHEAPCCILTSMVKGVDVSVDQVIHDAAAGTFAGGVKEFGLAEQGVNYIYDDHNRKWIPDEVRQRVEELRQEIIAKKIEVPWK
jgi:basic membrane protein A